MQRSIQYNFQEENIKMKETILLFNITDRNTKLKLERILLPLKLRIRRIPVSQYGQTLAALCGLEEPVALPSESAVTPSFSDPMMIFAGLSEMTLNRVLAGLRAQQIRIPYKAILTSTNQHWTPEECFIEIKKEHEQMHGLNQ